MHPTAWLIWVACAAVAVSASRNPLYLLLLLLVGLWAAQAARPATSASLAPVPVTPGRFAAFVVGLAALFNVVTTHVGATVIVRLPPGLPVIGGPLTAEALVYGATNGLVLGALFAVFVTLQRAVPIRDLIRFIPRAFYPVAVVISIAVTFVPATLRQAQQIREAQAVRGHRLRSLRDWQPLLTPLLVGGMERALQLAEAMTARGFAGRAAEPGGGLSAALPMGLFVALAGGLLLIFEVPGWGVALAGLGALVIGAALRRAGRRAPHTTYRRRPLAARDRAAIAGAVAALGLFLATGAAARAYSPYPALTVPPFDPLAGGGLVGLLVPVVATGEDAP